MAAPGQPFDPIAVVHTAGVAKLAGIRSTIVHTTFGIPGGVEAAEKLLAANPKMTMIIANADTLAVGIVQGLAARGVHVPDDISVMSAANTIYKANPSAWPN